MSIVQLPSSTIKLITSSQIITSVSSAVKELMENSLDAGATSLDIKLMNNGLDRLEVKDNGSGINRIDTPHMALPHYTSKITSFGDLEKVHSYGFRGEALNAICQVGQVTVTTATKTDPMSMTYTLDSGGNVTGAQPSHHAQGTTVTVLNIFKNLPVRRQFVGSGRRAQEELKQVEVVVKSLAVIKPKCRVTLTHNKCLLWQKTVSSSLQTSFSQMIGYSTCQQLELLSFKTSSQASVDMLIPKRNCDIEGLCKSTQGTSLIFVNERIVTYKKILKVLHQQLNSHFGEKLSSRKYAVCLISITVPPAELDVNLNPSKTQILLKDEDTFLLQVEKQLSDFYSPVTSTNDDTTGCGANVAFNSITTQLEGESSSKRRKLEVNASSSTANEQLESQLAKQNSLQNKDEFYSRTDCNERPEENGKCSDNKLLFETNSSDFQQADFTSNSFSVAELSEHLNCLEDHHNRNISSFNEGLPNDTSLFEESLFLENHLNRTEADENGDVVQKNIQSDILASISDTFTQSLNKESSPQKNYNSNPNVENRQNNFRDLTQDFIVDTLCSKITSTPSETSIPILSEAGSSLQPLNNEAWSMGHLPGENGGFVQGACVLVPGHGVESNDKICTNDASPPSVVLNTECRSEPDKIYSIFSSVNPPMNSKSEDVGFKSSSKEQPPPKSPKHSSPKRKTRKSPGHSEMFGDVPLDSSLLSVSSQMGRKELSAFTKFAREIRPQIILQNPGIAFTRVAAMLAEQWRVLPIEEKEHYEEIARQTATNRKVWQTADNKQKKLDWVQRLSSNKGNINCNSNKNNSSSVNKSSKEEIVCDYTIDCIKVKCLKADSSSIFSEPKAYEAEGISLVGQLEPSGSWICMEGSQICLLNHYRLQEVVVNHRLLETFVVPLKALPVKEDINQQVLGEEAWRTLLSLECKADESNSKVVTSDAISKNGFRIEISEGGETAALTHVAETINFYGLRELKEVLELAKLCSPINLSKCRPLRVINHIKGEAMRICRKSPSVLERAMVEELLRYWRTTMNFGNRMCLHSESILTPVFNLSDSVRNNVSSLQ